jgi:hypothetical protein
MIKFCRVWHLFAVVLLFVTSSQSYLSAEVSLLESASNYLKEIDAAVKKTNFLDVFNASTPLVLATSTSIDLGLMSSANWYRLPPEVLVSIRDALTSVATRLLAVYKVYDEEFAALYDDNPSFQAAILSVNDSSRMLATDPIWLEFIDGSDNKQFYTLFTLLRKRRDLFRAAIDPATLASSGTYTLAEIRNPASEINKLLTKPSLPTGAPANGDVVIIKLDVNGSRQYLNAIKTDDGIILGASGRDPLDPSALFKLNTDFDVFGLQLTSAEGLFLSAENIVASAGWLPTKKQKVTRMAFTQKDFGPAASASGKFILERVGSSNQFNIRCSNYLLGSGYVKIDVAGDLSVRVLDPASSLNVNGNFVPYGASDATPIGFIKFTDFHKTLSDLRLSTDVPLRITGYTKLLDSAAISTIDDYLFLVAEAQMYVDANRSSAANWKAFSDGGGLSLTKALIQKLRQNMVAVPANQSAPTAATYALQNNAISALEVALNAGMNISSAGPRFADGSPIKDALVIIVTGNGSMLSVGEAGSIVSVNKDLADQAAQFIAEIDTNGNVSFKSPAVGNRFIQAGAITTNVAGWLAQARLDISRATCLRTSAGQAEKFILDSQGTAIGTYSFKNIDSQGYLYAGQDNMVRSLDTSGSAATLSPFKTVQTVFSFVPVDGFIKKLAALRFESQDKIRVDSYLSLVDQILTSLHVDLLLQEINLFVGKITKSSSQWNAWKSTGLDQSLKNAMTSTALKNYVDKSVHAEILKKLTDGYSVDTSVGDLSGLTAGDTVVLQSSEQEASFLQVQDNGTVKLVVGEGYLLDPACQFVVMKSQADGSIIGFQSAYLKNLTLRAPDISLASSNAKDLLVDRLSVLSCAKVDGQFDEAASFEMVQIMVPGKITITISQGDAFKLKRKNKDGYLKVGAVDGLVRFFDEASSSSVLQPISDAAATRLSYQVISSLQKKFTDIRGLKEDVAKISEYNSLLSTIITLGDLKLLLVELQKYIKVPRVDSASYLAFKNIEGSLNKLLNQIETTFGNALVELQADPKVPKTNELRALFNTQLVQSIPVAFALLSTADKISNLENMFASVTTVDKATQFLTLFAQAMLDRSMFTDALLVKMKSLYQSLLLNNYTKVNTDKFIGSDEKQLDAWARQLNTSVKFADIFARLQPLIDKIKNITPSTAIDDGIKNQFVSFAARLTTLLDTASDDERIVAGELLDSAAYTYLYDRKNNIVPVSNLIKNYVRAQNVPASYAGMLDELDKALRALTLTSPVAAMDKFISDATTIVSQRAQGLDDDVVRLTRILDDALWHPMVLNQPALAAGKQRFDAQIKALINITKVAIPFSDLVLNISNMLDKNTAFVDSDISYFIARANQLVSQKGGQNDPVVIDSAIRVLTRGSRYQVSSQRVELDKLIAQLISYKSSLTGSSDKSYSEKRDDIKNMLSALDTQAASRRLTDAEVEGFFDELQNLVDKKLEGTPSQVDNLIEWLSSSAVSTSRLISRKTDGISLVQKIISVLGASVSISDRIANLQAMLQKHPQFVSPQLKLDFIEKANFLTSTDSRQQAASEKFDIRTSLGQILAFSKANQFASDTTPNTGVQNLDRIIAQLNAPLNQVLSAAVNGGDIDKLIAKFNALNFATKVSELDRAVYEVSDATTGALFVSLVEAAVLTRISGKDTDILRLKKVIQTARRSPGIGDDPSKLLLAKLDAAQTDLSRELVYSDYSNAINAIVAAFPADVSKISEDTKNTLVSYAQKLADNLVSSIDQPSRNSVSATLKKMAFNQLADRYNELLKICDVIESYVPSEQVGRMYTKDVTDIALLVDDISADNVVEIVTQITSLVNRRAEGVATDFDLLKKTIDKLIWHDLIQDESGQGKLKILNDLLKVLAQPIPARDLINLLSKRLENKTFAPDDVAYFHAKAQMLIDQRASIQDKSMLTIAINLLNQASRYQMTSKRAALDQMVVILQAQSKSFVQKDYVSFADRLAEMKKRLTDLDLKTQSRTLSADDAALFIKDLETLVNDRAQGIAAKITELSSWLQTSATESRFFFLTRGAKEKSTALRLVLQQPVAYVDQYNYLISLLSDYPNFSSAQMTTDFFDKCTYLVSDDGKKQALSEGFDYKRFEEVLVFASQNQVSSSTEQVAALIAQLRLPVTGLQEAAKSFADKLISHKNRLSSLTDVGTNLSDYVTELEELVTSRFDANAKEIEEFKDHLQKVLWNSVLRESVNSNLLLGRIQASIDGLLKPILFSDLSAYLITVSTGSLAQPEEQNRFIGQVRNLLSIKDQTNDAAMLDQVITAVKLVAFNQLQRRTELLPIITQLEAYRNQLGKQVTKSFSQQRVSLKGQIASLNPGTIDKFLSELSALVSGRFEADADQLKLLVDLVTEVSWINIIRSDTQKGYPAAVAKLIKEATRKPSFAERLADLSSMLTGSEILNDVLQDSFVQKTTQLFAVKIHATIPQLQTVINQLQIAIFNQVKGRAQELQDLLNSFTRYLQNLQLTGGMLFGDRIQLLQEELAEIREDSLTEFRQKVKDLFDSRVDATDEEISKLKVLCQAAGWNNVVVALNNKGITAPYNDFTKWYNEVDAPINFNIWKTSLSEMLRSDVLSEVLQKQFMRKTSKLLSMIPRTAKADLDDAQALLLQASFNQMAKYKKDLDVSISRLKDASKILATGGGMGKSFDQKFIELKKIYDEMTPATMSDFISNLSTLIDSRIEATDENIKELKEWLNLDSVQNNRIIFLNGGLDQIQPLIGKLDEPITFAQRVENLRFMIQAVPTFTAADGTVFLAKVDKLISERWRAVQENFNIEDVVKLLKFVQVNQFSLPALAAQSKLVTAKIAAIQGPVVEYLTYKKRYDKLEEDFKKVGSNKNLMNTLLKDFTQMVVDRVDGSDEERATVVSFIRLTIMYHPLVYDESSPFRSPFQKCIDGLMAPITYGELYTNFKKLLGVAVYSQDHKDLFIKKLQVLVDNRADAKNANVDLAQLGRDVTFVKINKFSLEMLDDQKQTPPDRNPTIKQIEDLAAQLDVASVSTLTGEIAKVYNSINTLSPENWAAASADQKNGLLAKLRILSNNVDETTVMTDKKAIDELLKTAKAIVFKTDQASVDLLAQYRTQIATFGPIS